MATSTMVPRQRCQWAGRMPVCGHLQRRACEGGEGVFICRGGRASACAAELQGRVPYPQVHYRLRLLTTSTHPWLLLL